MKGGILITVWQVRGMCRRLVAYDIEYLQEAVKMTWHFATLGGDALVSVSAEWISQTTAVLLATGF